MSGAAAEDNDQIRPWASDERLKDPKLLAKMELAITTIQEIAKLFQRLPEGRHMPMTESIPKLWETVKDLKAESLKELQATFRTMSKASKINEDKNNLKSAGSKRGKEDKEASDSDESDSSADKKPKKDSHIENIERYVFDEEGYNSNVMCIALLNC